MNSSSLFALILIHTIFFFHNSVYSQIEEKYQKLGGKKSVLGKPTMEKPAKAAKGGLFQRYEKGNIYWHPNTGAWAVYDDFLKAYRIENWEKGELGYPISAVMKTPDKKGKFCRFEGGNIYWSKKTGAHAVKGVILEKWGDYKYERGVLGYPIAPEGKLDEKGSRYQCFKGGNIYWTEKTGAHAVYGKILKRWGQLKWEQGKLGLPVSDQMRTPDRYAYFQIFENGNIYDSKEGIFEVCKKILKKYGEFDYERGTLGYPLTGELDVGDNRGKYNVFEDGVIFWTKETGPHELHGVIWEIFSSGGKWKTMRLPDNNLWAYPVTDVLKTHDGQGAYADFEYGKIKWDPSMGNTYLIHVDDRNEDDVTTQVRKMTWRD